MRDGKVKMAVRIPVFAALSVMLVLLSGCWDSKDLTEINMVTAIGIDRSTDGKILVTIQVVEPAAIQSTSSGKGKGGITQARPVFVESYESETVFGALREMLSIVDNKLFLGTAQVLILGEGLSRHGINEALDFFQRDHEIEYDTLDVLVAKDATPADLLGIETDMDPIPAIYIKSTVENAVFRGTLKRTILIDLIKDIACDGRQAAIGRISRGGEKEVSTEGTAVFRHGKLAGWLDPYETRGYLFATGKVKNAVVDLVTGDGKIAIEIKRSKAKVNVEFKNGEPFMLTVMVRLEANLGDYEAKGKLDSSDALSRLQDTLSEEVKKEIYMALSKAQKEYQSDIFGFGAQLRKYHPAYWKNEKDKWNEIFGKMPVDIKVNAEILRTGVIKSPVKCDE